MKCDDNRRLVAIHYNPKRSCFHARDDRAWINFLSAVRLETNEINIYSENDQVQYENKFEQRMTKTQCPTNSWHRVSCRDQKRAFVFLFLNVYAFPRPFPAHDGTLLLVDP